VGEVGASERETKTENKRTGASLSEAGWGKIWREAPKLSSFPLAVEMGTIVPSPLVVHCYPLLRQPF